MSKEKLGNELSFAKIGYKPDRWKWVLSLPSNPQQKYVTGDKTHSLDKSKFHPHPNQEDITHEHLWKSYGLDKLPKALPCPKRCFQTPWCLGGLRAGGGSGKGGSRIPLSQQPRQPPLLPVGLQNTANTCWINSALQLFFHLPKFRNAVNSVADFCGDESLDSLVHLLQVVFAEMEMHPFKAIACEPGSVFERLGMFASREVMKKDANNELLKCVSEFMENTIDWLVAGTKLATVVAPMFTISLTRLAKWQCSKCSAVHEYQLSPASCYTMGAYISADQAPLQQCLMDLQAETQTGVIMVCGGSSPGGGQAGTPSGGCGASVKVDRVVTPKLGNLPNYLIIRNNSLMAEDVKRRLHVVYPETLDLSEHTLDGRAAHYELAAVIFHHGHWVKHYSAQVKTEGGRWFSFNDESVMEMSFKAANNAQGNPQENHPNYFSLGSVSNKFKSRNGERVSRGAFIWLYTLVGTQPELPYVAPQPAIVEYIARHRTVKKNDNSELLKVIHGERQSLLKELAVTDVTAPYALLPEWLLLAWLASQDCRFVAPSRALQQLQDCVCDHGNLRPMLAHAFKCVRMDKVAELLSHRCGIHLTHEEETVRKPLLSKEDSDLKCYPGVNDVVHSSVNSTLTCVNISSQSEPVSFPSKSSNTNLSSTSSHRDVHNNSFEMTTQALRNLLRREGTKREADSHQEAPTTSTSNDSGSLPDSCHNGTSHFKVKPESSNGSIDSVAIGDDESLVDSSSKSSEVVSSTTSSRIYSPSPQSNSPAPVGGLSSSSTTNKLHVQGPGGAALHSSSVISSTTDVPSSGANSLLSDAEISSTEGTSCAPKVLLSGSSLPLLVAEGAVLPGAEHQCQECVLRHARHILFLEQLRALHKQCKKEAIKQEQSSYRPIGIQSLELWPKIATRKYMKDNNVDLSFGPENIPDQNPDEEERAKASSGAPDSSNGVDDSSTPSGASSSNDNNNRTGGATSGSDGSCDTPSAAQSESPAGGAGGNDTVVEEVLGFKLFNEDLVCSHFQLNPQAVKFYIPQATYSLLVELCGEDIHPATVLDDFEACQDCQSVLVASESACERGLEEKRRLAALFNERRRPAHGKDRGSVVYLLDRDFFDDWRTFVRGCQRGQVDKRPELTNADFMCDHKQLQYNPALMDAPRITELWVVLWEDEWATLVELYGAPVGGAVRAVITPDGFTDLQPAVCSAGCVESQQVADYEDQFEYDSALIYVRQVHTPDDIPQRAAANTRSMGPAVTPAAVPVPNPSCSATPAGAEAISGNEGLALDEHRVAVNGAINSSPAKQVNGNGYGVTVNGAADGGVSNSVDDVSSNQTGLLTSDNSEENEAAAVTPVSKRPLDSPGEESPGPRKMPRLTPSQDAASPAAAPSRASGRKRGARVLGLQAKGTASKSLNTRLVRASKSFASTDTIRQVQNFIAERTSVWPMLQTVWLGWTEDLATVLSLPHHETAPVLLQEEHLTRTLGALRVRPGDTIYFKAAKEDMEKAAGDGIVEYDELPA